MNNTLLFVGLGALVVYVVIKKKAAAPVVAIPSGSVPLVNTVAPANSQSLLLNLFNGAAGIAKTIISDNNASNNVAQGYNADGTIALSNTTQDSVTALNTTLDAPIIPVILSNNLASSMTNNPNGANSDDDES